jgi:predicted transcriptional regulator
METANMMRVNARSGSFAGNGSAFHDKQQQHRQKMLALFEAINSANLDAASHAFQALVNFDVTTMANPHFARLSKLLEAGSIYLAQQLVKEIKSALVNAQPLQAKQTTYPPAPKLKVDGLHIVDLRA